MCDNAEVLKQNKKSAEYVTRKQEERVNQNRYTVHRLSAQDYYEQARQLSDKRHNYLRNHVRSAIVDKLGGERYKAFDDLKIKKAGEEAEENITLHHAAGSKYALDGEDVVEFNIAGSGFRYPRMEHKDMTAWENTDEFREEDIKVSWYNRFRPFTWLPKVKTKKRIEQINANRTEMNRKIEDIYGERAGTQQRHGFISEGQTLSISASIPRIIWRNIFWSWGNPRWLPGLMNWSGLTITR